MIYEREHYWYFSDETGEEHGPYTCEEEAELAQFEYCLCSGIGVLPNGESFAVRKQRVKMIKEICELSADDVVVANAASILPGSLVEVYDPSPDGVVIATGVVRAIRLEEGETSYLVRHWLDGNLREMYFYRDEVRLCVTPTKFETV